jgi:transketolase
MAAVLWSKYLRFDPTEPHWGNRDRFILSAGHGCMLLYSLLHLFGYELSIEDLKQFRQWESLTPGHPEWGMTPGVEATTGPLGQGFANGVGMALSGKLLAERYSKELFNYRVFGIVSDGDLMEGVAAEAASMAGHLGLDNLTYLYDDNLVSLAAPTSICFTESVPKRLEACGWWVKSIDGHDLTAIAQALDEAEKIQGKPKIICCRTTLGFGSPNRAGTHEVHGAPLGKDELKATKEKLGIPLDPTFWVPEDVKTLCAEVVSKNTKLHSGWNEKYSAWAKENPEKAARYQAQVDREIPTELRDELVAAFKDNKKDATRNHSSVAVQVIAKRLPGFIGGSADLDPSTKTKIKGSPDVTTGKFAGNNLHFGVREHAMGSVINGFAYQQCWFPYSATFLTFSDYMRPTIRLAALCHLQSIFIFTHESFYLGEDGPTHQPVEHTMTLRMIPNLHVWRPADGLEVAMSYYGALQRKDGPSTLLFTRQNLTPIDRASNFDPESILRGGYVAYGEKHSDLVLIATGSEVSLAIEVSKSLEKDGKGARVVSMPCVERYLAQDSSYRSAVVPPNAKKVSLEAGITTGWERIVGGNGIMIGLDHFGASAPAEVLAEKFGFTVAAVRARLG